MDEPLSAPSQSAAAAAAAAVPATPSTPIHPPLLYGPTNPLSPMSPRTPSGRAVHRSDFKFGKVIGEGSFSTVYHAQELISGRPVAIKEIEQKKVIRSRKVRYIHIEKQALKILKHPFIVRLHSTFKDSTFLYFVLEYCEKGDLLHLIRGVRHFDTDAARFYLAELIVAVEYMHKTNVLHRDLKPENIVLDSEGHIRVTDFGCAKILDTEPTEDDGNPKPERKRSFVGTPEYCSPELITSQGISWPCDVWAVGCILYQMLAGRPPFKAPNEYLTFKKIQNLEYNFPPEFDPVAKDLVEKILVLDQETRYTLEDIKAHEFFKGFDWVDLHLQTPPVLQPQPVATPDSETLDKIASRIISSIMIGDTPEFIHADAYSDDESASEAEPTMPTIPAAFQKTAGLKQPQQLLVKMPDRLAPVDPLLVKSRPALFAQSSQSETLFETEAGTTNQDPLKIVQGQAEVESAAVYVPGRFATERTSLSDQNAGIALAREQSSQSLRYEFVERNVRKLWRLSELLPQEQVIKCGALILRRTFFSKRRMVVLTAAKIIILEGETGAIKDQISLGAQPTVQQRTEKTFTVTVGKRSWVFEEPTKQVQPWIEAIKATIDN
ncbi:kinase-like domain-containing protein [Polychytrium aggregatum]|uniref:kinase-like domain-containing protein n=1 Tax=Polychytrium aggregatum TaxID=110093 RepID=UPI0022FDB4D8|nr:kinase-like domain-containing protein [Polychytrium aggregatum]KAI9209429.1 kinase-like domain-containing protein [Polychytrium aggregatum]